MIDPPSEPIAVHVQAIRAKLVACGLRSSGFTVRYEDELQGIEISIGPDANASSDKFECILQAAGHEIITFGSAEQGTAFSAFSYEHFKCRIFAENRAELDRRGLLADFPERSDFSSDIQFAEALERHCGFDPGSFFVEREFGVIIRPAYGPRNEADLDRRGCLLTAMTYAQARGDTFKIGFIGNEAVVQGK